VCIFAAHKNMRVSWGSRFLALTDSQENPTSPVLWGRQHHDILPFLIEHQGTTRWQLSWETLQFWQLKLL